MTEEYKKYLTEILTKILKNEEIIPKPIPEHPLVIKSKETGTKKVIQDLFKENVSIIQETVSDPYKKIDVPSNNPDHDKYWESLIPKIKLLGDSTIDPTGEATVIFDNTGNEKENLKITFVKDEDNSDKPGLMFQFTDSDTTIASDITALLEKNGIGYDKQSIKDLSDKVFIQII
jgi:hypothetical protein